METMSWTSIWDSSTKKYHESYDGTHKSQAVDLAGFLLYMEFDPEREPASSWKRVIKP